MVPLSHYEAIVIQTRCVLLTESNHGTLYRAITFFGQIFQPFHSQFCLPLDGGPYGRAPKGPYGRATQVPLPYGRACLRILTAPYSLNQRAKIGMPGSSIIQ